MASGASFRIARRPSSRPPVPANVPSRGGAVSCSDGSGRLVPRSTENRRRSEVVVSKLWERLWHRHVGSCVAFTICWLGLRYALNRLIDGRRRSRSRSEHGLSPLRVRAGRRGYRMATPANAALAGPTLHNPLFTVPRGGLDGASKRICRWSDYADA